MHGTEQGTGELQTLGHPARAIPIVDGAAQHQLISKLVGICGHDGRIQWSKEHIHAHTLATIMRKLGHTGRRIDVLKLDIEGSEFDVVLNLVESGIDGPTAH